MTRIHPLPPYLNHIAEYAVENMAKNGLDLSDCLYTSLKINILERQVIFSQRVKKIGETIRIDCWDIFQLSKTILDDPLREFDKLTVIVWFKNGKVNFTDYKIYE